MTYKTRSDSGWMRRVEKRRTRDDQRYEYVMDVAKAHSCVSFYTIGYYIIPHLMLYCQCLAIDVCTKGLSLKPCLTLRHRFKDTFA
jgi:hypothetical protein